MWPFLVEGLDSGIRRFVRAWVLTASAIAFLAGLQYFQSGYRFERVTGSFEDPNLFGLYLIMSLGLALWWGGQNKSLVSFVPACAITLAVIATASRGSLFALMALLVALGLVVPARSMRSRATRGLVAGAGLLGVYVFADRIPAFDRLPVGDLDIQGEVRYQLWALAIELWSDIPLTGIGLGQFAANVRYYLSVEVDLVTHNTIISFLVELGVLGLILFLFPFVFCCYQLWRVRRGSSIAPYLMATWVAVFVGSLTLNIQYLRFVWAFLALSVATVLVVRIQRGGQGEAGAGA